MWDWRDSLYDGSSESVYSLVPQNVKRFCMDLFGLNDIENFLFASYDNNDYEPRVFMAQDIKDITNTGSVRNDSAQLRSNKKTFLDGPTWANTKISLFFFKENFNLLFGCCLILFTAHGEVYLNKICYCVPDIFRL